MVHEIIKKEIREIIESHLSSCVNYEWEGGDFNERLFDQCNDQNEEVFKSVELDSKEPTIQFDYELYNKFIDHLTEFVHSGISVKKENEYV